MGRGGQSIQRLANVCRRDCTVLCWVSVQRSARVCKLTICVQRWGVVGRSAQIVQRRAVVSKGEQRWENVGRAEQR